MKKTMVLVVSMIAFTTVVGLMVRSSENKWEKKDVESSEHQDELGTDEEDIETVSQQGSNV